MKYAIRGEKITVGAFLEVDKSCLALYAEEKGVEIFEFREIYGEQLNHLLSTIELEEKRKNKESRRKQYEELKKEFE